MFSVVIVVATGIIFAIGIVSVIGFVTAIVIVSTAVNELLFYCFCRCH